MKPPETTPSEQGDLANILARIANHDVLAFRTLYEKTLSKLRGYVGSIVRDASLVEDILQISFIRIWENAASHDPSRGSTLGWMLAISKSVAYDELRKLQASERRDMAAAEIPVSQPSSYIDESIDDYLTSLRFDQAQALRAVYTEGLTHTELADRLDEPLGTVKSRIRRGIAAVRKQIDRPL